MVLYISGQFFQEIKDDLNRSGDGGNVLVPVVVELWSPHIL